MYEVNRLIKNARLEIGWSQTELANQAGVGLATIQNIEANRANPSLETVCAILNVLGIEMRFARKKPKKNWPELAALGCPILLRKKSGFEPSRARLAQILGILNPRGFNHREGRAVAAWLQAIRDHYPSLWPTVPAATRAWVNNQPVQPKLRRIALAQLGAYL